MNSPNQNTNHRALVTVFEDKPTAVAAVQALHEAGFSTAQMELVTHDFHIESPDVDTPKVHETTTTSLIDAAERWGGVGLASGAAAGLITAVLTPFPGAAIGMLVIGGVTGAILGGMAGVEHAVDDDSVDLPTIKEYDQLLRDGHQILVVHGTHEDALRAKGVIAHLKRVHEHVHPIHGHEFHEHPSDTA